MRRAILKLIHEQSPQRPACFDTHQQWVQWLVSAHAGGLRVVRRADIGKHRGERHTYFAVLPVGQQSHCLDCSLRRQAAMRDQARCFPVKPKPNPADESAANCPSMEPTVIVTKSEILKHYEAARKTLDPIAAVSHVAGITGQDPVVVEGVIQQREAWQSSGGPA